jgi:ribonuclease-3
MPASSSENSRVDPPVGISPDSSENETLQPFESLLGYVFDQKALLEVALTHSSFAFENQLPSNERLEFLGDSLLNFVVSEYLYHHFSDASEGELSRMRAQHVSRIQLKKLAVEMGFHRHLVLGKGMQGAGKNRAQSGNLLEAVIGAIFLDSGFMNTREWVLEKFGPALETLRTVTLTSDPKSSLQEFCQKEQKFPPRYFLVRQEGPPHDPRFFMEVEVNGLRFLGSGSSKKLASEQAALEAMKVLWGVEP